MNRDVYSAPTHWFVRRLIRTGASSGPSGGLGRWLGRHWGAPMPGGLHHLVTSPAEAIQSLMLANGLYEPTTCAILAQLVHAGRRVVYDVGANSGQHTLVCVAAGARVVAFEPVPRLLACLSANLKRNRLASRAQAVPVAASDRVGSAPFHVATRFDDGSHSLVPGVQAARIDTVLVTTTTLDAFVRANPGLWPDLIKVDVEGAEALVLDGAKELLQGQKRPDWIVETSDHLARQIGESAARVLARLGAHGYRVYRIDEHPARLRAVTASMDVSPIGNYLALASSRSLPRFRFRRLRTATGWIG